MKYVVLLGDGMADWAVESLGGKTPLAHAKTPHMDRIAREGTLGLIDTVPKGMKPGSDVAILSVLGYDPAVCYTGRGPLEAASMGVHLDPGDLAFRCNLVALGDGADPVMEDFTAGHITSEEAREIILDLDRNMGTAALKFYPGVGYRHLLVWKGGGPEVETTPPHDITGQATAGYLPQGKGAEAVLGVMLRSREVLKGHPVNRKRDGAGKKQATSIWLWGQGGKPAMEPLSKKYGLSGGMISAVDLLNGLGIKVAVGEELFDFGAVKCVVGIYALYFFYRLGSFKMHIVFIIVYGKLNHCLNGVSREMIFHQFIDQHGVDLGPRRVQGQNMPEYSHDNAVFADALIGFSNIEIFFYGIFRIAVIKIQLGDFSHQAKVMRICFRFPAAGFQFPFEVLRRIFFAKERE
ncbi:MAG: 2,3-bisphosphoglycerate-independent phosphoglycerate mutase [Syntrophales bacterium]|nr:2,3-bisphosphoglycerate-independent phosphoglycerate mutase [Syntrophales bacterium]